MLRFIPILSSLGARCFVQAHPTLRTLVQRSLPGIDVIARNQCPSGIDSRTPVMSLPLAMRIRGEADIPRAVPYVRADDGKAALWAKRLGGGLRVGLVWRGNPKHLNDANRSARLEDVEPLLGCEAVRFVTLQKALTDAESAILSRHAGLAVLDGELETLDDTAAVISVLDAVITVDSALAHLAGALGKPVWVMLAFSPEWRWMLGRGDSPWYPSARLFRQRSRGDWAGVGPRSSAAQRR